MMKGITPDKLTIAQLLARIKTENITELILATNPTIEGETTSQYIFNLLKNTDITITRLAYGLPMGGEIDYLDSMTIDRALAGRTKLK
jgi:recombination protein RecR